MAAFSRTERRLPCPGLINGRLLVLPVMAIILPIE